MDFCGAGINHIIKRHDHFLEVNDLFCSSILYTFNFTNLFRYTYEGYGILKYFGIGIFLYGVAYVVFHDIIVHRRIKISFKANNPYLKRIMNAHYVHHKVHTKEGAKAFGFLFAPKKYDVKND